MYLAVMSLECLELPHFHPCLTHWDLLKEPCESPVVSRGRNLLFSFVVVV